MADMLIMYKNIPVLSFNFDSGDIILLNKELIPFTIKDRLSRVKSYDEIKSKYEDTENRKVMGRNKDVVMRWLASRVLSLSRKNAKWLFNLLRIDQLDTLENKVRVSVKCRAVSVLDNYWIKLENSPETWEHKNVRKISLNKIITQVALHGSSLTLQGSLATPELTTNGAYAKAWRRHKDGRLWLYKLGADGNTESRIEVMVSKLLNKMPVQHCHYEAGEDGGKYVCMCPMMTNEEVSILPAMDYSTYCNTHDLNFDREIVKIDADSIYKMWIVDYLISNRDRHSQNWGFYYNAETMEIIGCHPLFDHNNAFDKEYMDNPDSDYQFGNYTLREAAKFAMKKVDFFFTEDITLDDFITEHQYRTFMSRARELGIEVRPYEANFSKQYVKRIIELNSYYNLYLDIQKTLDLLPTSEVSDEELIELLFKLSPIQSNHVHYSKGDGSTAEE